MRSVTATWDELNLRLHRSGPFAEGAVLLLTALGLFMLPITGGWVMIVGGGSWPTVILGVLLVGAGAAGASHLVPKPVARGP